MSALPVYQGARLYGWSTVDDDDYPELVTYLWKATRNGYVYRNLSGGGMEYLHRRILELPAGDERHADHISGDRLNNTRANLRPVLQAENNQNLAAKGVSNHRGVAWIASRKKWRAQSTVGGRQHHLGYFDREIDAARAAAEFRRQHMPHANPARDQPCEESSPKEAA